MTADDFTKQAGTSAVIDRRYRNASELILRQAQGDGFFI